MVPPQFLLLWQLLNDYQTQEGKEPTLIFLYTSVVKSLTVAILDLLVCIYEVSLEMLKV